MATLPFELDPELADVLLPAGSSPEFEFAVRCVLTQRLAKGSPVTLRHSHEQLDVHLGGRKNRRCIRLSRRYALSWTGERFRPDRQIHINQDPVRPTLSEAAVYNRLRWWGRDYTFVGQTRGVWVYRHQGMDDEWGYVALSVLDRVPTVPGITMALPLLADIDPIDPPDALRSLFADSPWWSPREVLADLLVTVPQWGYRRVRWVTGDAKMPSQGPRDKTVLYFQGSDVPTLVAQIFWEPQLPYPPFGLSPEPKPHPEVVEARPNPKPPKESPAAVQLTLFPEDRVAPAPLVTRDVHALADQAIAKLREAYQRFDVIITTLSGKDSLLATALVCAMVDQLPEEERTKTIYVLSSDTRVESPALIGVIDAFHRAIRRTAEERHWPIETVMVRPEGTETFWAQVLGKSYPPPNRLSRFCTRSMKLQPNDRWISALQAHHPGQKGVLVLGSRDSESTLRAQSNTRHGLGEDRFYADHPLPWMMSATPIRHYSTDEVFESLALWMPYWEPEVAQLLEMYRFFTGECPIAVSHSGEDRESQTQSIFSSCGSQPGRAGCFTCTVIDTDRSLRAYNDAKGGLFDGHLAIQQALRDAADPRTGLRAGIQRTRQPGIWTQGWGELTPTAVIWLLTLLLEHQLPLADDEIAAIGQIWHDRTWRGECRMPDKAWVLLDRHARAHQPIRMLSA